jgi:hypothetical protein
MKLRKIVLIALLIFAVASLFVIAIFAKNKIGFFGKAYDKHISEQSERIASVVEPNLNNIFSETKGLADSDITKSLFVSFALGESLDRFKAPFDSRLSDMEMCRKIQVVDLERRIVFSTVEDEIFAQRVTENMFNRFKRHFDGNNTPLVHFINTETFVSVSPSYVNPEGYEYHGYVIAYYESQRILKGLEKERLTIPFSVDNFIFVSERSDIDNEDINKIVYFYQSGMDKQDVEVDPKDKTIGAITKVHGLNIINYQKDGRFVPVEAIIFLIVTLVLMGLVLFVLIQTIREEKREDYYIPTSKAPPQSDDMETVFEDDFDMDAGEINRFNVPNQDEIQELVDDIESGDTYAESAANKGIENMIMSDDSSLTELPDFGSEQPPLEDEDIKLDDIDVPLESEEASSFDLEITENEFPLEGLEGDEGIVSEEKSEVSEFSLETPSDVAGADEETEMFAEQDRILAGVDEEPFIETPEPSGTSEFGFDSIDDSELPSEAEAFEPETIESDLPAGEITMDEIAPVMDIVSQDDIPEEEADIDIPSDIDELSEEIQEIESDIVHIGDESETGDDIGGVKIVEDVDDEADLNIVMDEIDETEELMEIEELTLSEDSAKSVDEQTVVEFDIDSAIAEVPSVEDGFEEEGEISLNANELESIGVDLVEEEVVSEEVSQEAFDLDTAISEVPFAEDAVEDEGEISLDADELAAIGVDLSNESIEVEEIIPEEAEEEFEISSIEAGIPEEEEVTLSAGIEDSPLGEDIGEPLNLSESPLGEDIGSPLDLETNPLGIEPGVREEGEEAIVSTTTGEEALSEDIDFKKVFGEPPVRLSSISSVEAYSDVALDIAKNSLNLSKVAVLKKGNDGFDNLITNDFEKPFSFSFDDPLIKKLVNKRKSTDVRGDLTKSQYLKEKFSESDLANFAELIFVPIIKGKEIEGIAVYAREQGIKEPTNLQKSELHNIGFLQNN